VHREGLLDPSDPTAADLAAAFGMATFALATTLPSGSRLEATRLCSGGEIFLLEESEGAPPCFSLKLPS
jgi:hypothetical protein